MRLKKLKGEFQKIFFNFIWLNYGYHTLRQHLNGIFKNNSISSKKENISWTYVTEKITSVQLLLFCEFKFDIWSNLHFPKKKLYQHPLFFTQANFMKNHNNFLSEGSSIHCANNIRQLVFVQLFGEHALITHKLMIPFRFYYIILGNLLLHSPTSRWVIRSINIIQLIFRSSVSELCLF